MATPPITIGPFPNVPAPGSGVRSDWAQQITHAVVDGDAAQAAHIADTSDAHHASAIGFVPTGTVSATNVQAAIAEVAADADAGGTTLANHLADTTDAHDASAISFIPYVDPGGSGSHLDSTDVQAVIEELSNRILGGINRAERAARGYVTDVVTTTALVDVPTTGDSIAEVTWPADFTRRYKVTAVVNWLEKTGTSADVEIALETGPGVVLTKARVAMPTGTSVGSGALLVVEPSAMTGTQVRRLTVKPSASTVTVGVGAQILVEDIGAS